MAEFPALPLFTDAFIADTTHLSAEETGAHLMLLMCAWRTPDCGLPDNDRALQRFSRVTPNRWPKIRERIMAFWTCESGRWFQKRLVKERDFVIRKCRSQSRNAKSRWLKSKESTDAAAMPKACQNDTPTPTPTYTEEDKSSSAAPAAPVFEDLFYGGEPAPKPVPEKTRNKRLFDRGAEVLGKKTGGMVSSLLKHVGQDYDRAETLMELAATKAYPRQWLGAVLKGDAAARADVVLDETTALYEAWGVS